MDYKLYRILNGILLTLLLFGKSACYDSPLAVVDGLASPADLSDLSKTLLDGTLIVFPDSGFVPPTPDGGVVFDLFVFSDGPKGICGNGVQDANEKCDDGITQNCATDHDGGDGTCVPSGTCVSGYVLDASGNCIIAPTGLSVPCAQGPGWTLFRFQYGGGGTSPSLDVWDATCSYSYAPNSACNVYAVYPGFGEVSHTPDGYFAKMLKLVLGAMVALV